MARGSNSERKLLADAIDQIDAQIKDLNASKSDAYKTHRQKLEDRGMDARRAAAEVAAIKAAVARRRKLADDPTAVREKDDLIDEILLEIMGSSRAREEDDESTTPNASNSGADSAKTSAAVTTTNEPATDPKQVTAADPAGERAQDPNSPAEPQSPVFVEGSGSTGGADVGGDGGANHPATGAPATEGDDAPPASSVVQFTAKKQWKHSDKAHPDCLNAAQCGGFSNLGLCPQCKEAAAGGQVA